MIVLDRLRAVLEAEGGRPVRLDALARELGVDPAVLAPMVEHLARRGLLGAGIAPTCHGCPVTCAGPASRGCPEGR